MQAVDADFQSQRKAWLGLLAKADGAQVEALCAPWADTTFDWLRPPEVGGVMVRGRMGGTGAPFNLGEMTVTRCALRLPSGEVGHGYVQGRNKAHSQRAAMIDALMQTDASAQIRADVLAPLQASAAEVKAARAEKAAATKVDFFTMVRGED
jgi:alpha-D-ribose 1-methylphosphonate 5-triphosphate synthase subunit PhnG